MVRLLKKSAKPFIRECHLYLAREGGRAIIASTYNHGGMFAEKPGGVVSCEPSLFETLGQQIRQKLEECEYQEKFDYSGAKKSDWPAYQESGLKTVKAFESNFAAYRIQGVNEANLIWQIASPALQKGIALHSTISASVGDAELGEWVSHFHDFFLKFQTVDLRPRKKRRV